MIAGDPYETKELDELRSKQRRLAPAIRSLLGPKVGDVIATVEPIDIDTAIRDELALRHVADLIIADHVDAANAEAAVLELRDAMRVVRSLSGGHWVENAQIGLELRIRSLYPTVQGVDEQAIGERERALRDTLAAIEAADALCNAVGDVRT